MTLGSGLLYHRHLPLGVIGRGIVRHLLVGPTSAIDAWFRQRHLQHMIALVASLTLAADYCPDIIDGSEASRHALLLMSINNLATPGVLPT